MNISYDGTAVRFKTEPKELFEAQKSGAKSNIVRIIDIHEYEQLRKHEPSKIIIQHEQEIFLRTLSYVYLTEMIFGKYIAIFSWNPNEGHASADKDVKMQESSLDAQAINISLSLRETLDSLRGDKTYTVFISNLLLHVKFEKQKEETEYKYKDFLLADKVLEDLRRISPKNSPNSIIQELVHMHKRHTEKISDVQKHMLRIGYDIKGKDAKKVGRTITNLKCWDCKGYLTKKTDREFYCDACNAIYRIDSEGVFYHV